MKRLIMLLYTILNFSCSAKCQSNDTLSSKVVWINNLKECFLIGIVSSCSPIDTIVILSPKSSNVNTKYRRKIIVGQLYIFALEKDIDIASPIKKMSVRFKSTTVWTSEEPYSLKPRLCLNCIGEYVN